MLQRILIQNYALIDSLELDLNKGLNIITGETGQENLFSLVHCLLILGQRSDSSSLLDKNRKCIIEGEFVVQKNNHSIPEFFKSNELDFDKTILVRRNKS